MNTTDRDTQDMQRQEANEALEHLARASLDDSVAHLDAATLSRLNRARQQALAEVSKPYNPGNWLSLTAAAFAIVAIAIALPLLQHQDSTQPQAMDPAAFNVAEDAALLEDLDLVLWLMESEDHAS